jgi:hypothetical protein
MHPGKVLNYIPDHLEIEDEDDKACCVALECYSCAFLSDLTGLGAMQLIENGSRKLNVQVFCKYIYSWPCRLCLHCWWGPPHGESDENSNFL